MQHTVIVSTIAQSALLPHWTNQLISWSCGTAQRVLLKIWPVQCLPHFFSASAAHLRDQGKLDNTFLILVATSGDTGKAALEGFRNKEGIQIAVLYPDGGVSDIQYKQMATQKGENVMVWAVGGNFDDCQTGVKNVFSDESFAEHLMAEHKVALSSANSINWGRLLPQVVYYVSSYAELVAQGKLEAGQPLDVWCQQETSVTF